MVPSTTLRSSARSAAHTDAAPQRPAPAHMTPDILDLYLDDIKRHPLLTADEEQDVARRVRAGDPVAAEELVRGSLRFVVSIAKRFQNRGLPLADLIGEGNVGLMTAAQKFDPDQGVKFITYAVWWIRQSMISAIARQGRTVRVPLNRAVDLARVLKAAALLRGKLTREATAEEIAYLTNLTVAVVRRLQAVSMTAIRLDAPMSADGAWTVGDRFRDETTPDPATATLDAFLTHEVELALTTLPTRDARVLRLYFGMEDGREHTLEEIGTILGVTRERVRQIRDRALRKIRTGDRAEALRSFRAA